MHKVRPSIQLFNEKGQLELRDVTVVTLRNKGVGYEWRYSFGEGFEILKEGETVSFEAGANTVFTEDTILYVEPIAPQVTANGDYPQINIMSNRLTEMSATWARFFGLNR